MKKLENLLKRLNKEELCSLTGMDATNTKETMINALMERFNSMLLNKSLLSSSQNTVNYKISNGITVLPQGGLVTKKYSGKRPSLVRKYKRGIIEGTVEGFLILKNEGNIIKITNTDDYKLIKKIFGTVVPNEDSEYVEGCSVVTAINFKKMARYVDGVTFDKKFIRESVEVDTEDSLYGANNDIFIFNSEAVRLMNYIELDSIKSLAEYYINRPRIKKNQYHTKMFTIDDIVFKNGKYVLPKEAKCKEKISESRLAREFGSKVTLEDGTVQYQLYNFSTFNGSVTNRMVMDNIKSRGYVYKDLSKAERKTCFEESKEILLEKVKFIIMEGYYDEELNRHFNPCSRSFSQARQSRITYSSEKWTTVANRLLCGDPSAILDENGKCNVSKYDGRKALAATNSKSTSLKPMIKVIKDNVEIAESTCIIPEEIIKPFGDVILKKTETGNYDLKSKLNRFMLPDGYLCEKLIPKFIRDNYICNTACDGQASATVEFLAKATEDLGLMSKAELDYFLEAYKDLNLATLKIAIDGNSRLRKIFKKVQRIIQFRHGGDKGIVVMDDFNKRVPEYADYDILMPESVRKYDSDAFRDETGRSKLEFSVVSLNHKKTGKSYLNYQAIGASDIDSKNLIELAETEFSKVKDNILSNPVAAKTFLGLVKDTNSEYNLDYEEKHLVSVLTEALEASDEILKDEYINSKLRKLVGNYLYEVAFGRIQVEGDYNFLVVDPLYLTDRFGCLQSGEFYLNNIEGEVVLTRNPLIDKSEARKITTCKNDRLWYLEDLMVLNPFDDILPSLGGADVDGDHANCIRDERVIKFFNNKDYVINDNLKHKAPVSDINEDILRSFYRDSMEGSQLGFITDVATTFTDLLNSGCTTYIDKTGRKHRVSDVLKKLRFIQGWDIDKQKTGEEVVIPAYANMKVRPEWLLAKKQFKKNSEYFIAKCGDVYIDDERILKESDSPMTNLYKYSKARIREILTKKVATDTTLVYKLLKVVDKDEHASIKPRIAKMEKLCRERIIDVRSLYTIDDEMTQEEVEKVRKESWEKIESIYNEYRNALLSYVNGSISKLNTVVATAYEVCYIRPNNDNTKSRGFVWNVFRNELLDLLRECTKGSDLYRLPKTDEEVKSVVINNVGALFINGKFVETTDLRPGKYDVIEVEDSKIIRVPRICAAAQNRVVAKATNTNEFMTLVYSTDGESVSESIRTIQAKGEFTVQRCNDGLWVVVDKKPLMMVGSYGLNDVNSANGLVFKADFSESDMHYIPNDYQINNNVIEWTDEKEELAYRNNIDIRVKAVREISDEETIKVEDKVKMSDVVEYDGIDLLNYEEEITEGFEVIEEDNAEFTFDTSSVVEESFDDSLEVIDCEVIDSLNDNFDELDGIEVLDDLSSEEFEFEFEFED
ncbi:RNA dependent RNA polymerase family protein (plasmid) [Clostridium baratii str. Sullivan]|uniref:RNA dependent RNA polymerase family protein n=1 Tax=Clostridium baratii str. Sullivan TaxID=1415775 RepID=A0A0A7G060_9CLOT|nr:hypothetical protein [Clostridium baratii]AIY85227.1 RNA dependent RNA polymerase family protein [Clostridium baratii str. Sullivan]